jgi:hypothetical protein
MGLEAFLNLQEALVFGRSLGSCPLLFPYASLTATTAMPTCFFTREDGLLMVRPSMNPVFECLCPKLSFVFLSF